MMSTTKSSGIVWIGEIPSDWNVNKIKFTTQLNGRIGWQGLTSNEYQGDGPYLITGTDFNNGSINFESAVHIDESRWLEAKQIQVKNGDLLITKDGTVGKVAIISGLDDKASLNSGVLRIQPISSLDRKFLYYVLLSEEFWLWFNYTNFGASTILHLYQNVFDEFSFALPNLEEQQKIAAYLDDKVSKLDEAKNLLNEQNEKLKDYRKSVIYEVSTKGIDNEIELKETDIDWLPVIPTNWSVKRLKDFVSFKTGGTPKESIGVNQDEDGLKWFKPADFNDESISLLNSKNYITDEVVKETKINIYPENVVLLVGIASIGKVGISETKSYSNQQITALLNNSQLHSRYLAYVMSAMSQYIKETALYTVVPIVNNQYLSTLMIPFPNYKEQVIISKYIDEKIELVDKVIKNKQAQINVIEQQKKTLIYDYITGKRQVSL